MKNKSGFFNWQGNNLEYTKIGNYVVIIMIVVFLILSIIFKKQIRSFFKRTSNHKNKFKNIDFWLQVFAIIMIFVLIFRIIILVIYDYPRYYEHLLLHMCRLHFLIIALLFLFKKKDKIRYIVYMSFATSIVGMFGSTYIDDKFLNKTWAQNNINNPISIFALNGFTKYSAGPDTYFYWDYLLTHLIIGILPVFITIGVNKQVKTINFYRIILVYFTFLILLFITNALTDLLKFRGWRSNYWYVGRDRNNNFSKFLGTLTMWPYNFFTSFSFGIFVIYTGHLILMACEGNIKLKFQEFINDHKKINIKTLLNIK